MNLKQYQGKLLIFAIGYCGYTLYGLSPFSSMFWTILSMTGIIIFHRIWRTLARYSIAWNNLQRKVEWRINTK